MITLKTLFLPSLYLSSNTSTFTTLHHPHITTRKSSVFPCLCSTNNSNDESDSNSKPEGDVQSQELLAQIAMIQTQKVRLTDFLDERSEYLTQFGEEAKAEIDRIREAALQGLDEASDRITANIESQMLEFEENNEHNKQEIEESESKVMEIEGQMEVDRNEGLFFKNLGQKGPNVDKAKAKEEVEKMKDETREKSEGKTSKNVSLFFAGLITFGIISSVNVPVSMRTDWSIFVLGLFFAALFILFIVQQYEDDDE